jgi:hypothetical protein
VTDFEMQRRLRDMNAPKMPARDLWPAIAQRIQAGDIATPVAPASRRRWMPLAAAASILFALTGGILMLTLRQHAGQPSSIVDAAMPRVERITPSDARKEAMRSGEDPRLAGANIVLDAAHSELQQALESHPDAVFLVSLLNRTNAQRMKLEQFGAKAG